MSEFIIAAAFLLLIIVLNNSTKNRLKDIEQRLDYIEKRL